MNKRKDAPEVKTLSAVIGVIMLLVLAISIFGCSPRIIENTVVQRDTTYISKTQVDSIFFRDSTFIKEKGDTVYIYKEKIRDRYKFIHDTTSVVRIDSVSVERVKEVKVEKPLSWWQRFRQGAFWWLVLALAVAVVWIFKDKIFKII